MPDPQIDIDVIKEITDMFIEAGIHMDAVNVEGLTAVQNCTSRKFYKAIQQNVGPFFEFSFCFFSLFYCMSVRNDGYVVPSVQPTYKYCCDDMNSMRSVLNVWHHVA